MTVDPELVEAVRNDVLDMRMITMANELDLEQAEKLLERAEQDRVEALRLVQRVRQRLVKLLS